MKQIDISTAQHPNTFALVDDGDYRELSLRKWCTGTPKHCNIFYVRGRFQGKRVSMHRVIMKPRDGEVVDHIDGNGLNNQKSNLRICSNSQNIQNRRLNKNSSSGYKGVYWNKRGCKWQVQIGSGSRKTKKHLGLFTCLVKAARAYDAEALKRYGEYAKLNFERKENART